MSRVHVLNGAPGILDSLSWSDDGLISVTTPASIHILKPLSSGMRQFVIPSNNESNLSFKSTEKDNDIRISNVKREVFRMSTWSSDLAQWNGSQQIAVLTTSHQLYLFQQPDVHKQITWNMTKVLTHPLNAYFNIGNPPSAMDRDRLEVMSAAWCSTIQTNTENRNVLLGMGSKAGEIILMSSRNKYNIVHSMREDKGWITHLSFSIWKDGFCYLAAANSSGNIVFYKVAFSDDSITVSMKKTFESTSAGIISMKFYETQQNKTLCVICKGSSAILFSDFKNNEYTPLILDLPGVYPISGLVYESCNDCFRAYTHDARCYCISYHSEENSFVITSDLTELLQSQLQETKSTQNQILVYGAATSTMGLCDVILWVKSSPLVLDHHSANQKTSSLTFFYPNIPRPSSINMLIEKIIGKGSMEFLVWEFLGYLRVQSQTFELEIKSAIDHLRNEAAELDKLDESDKSALLFRCINYICVSMQGMLTQGREYFDKIITDNMNVLLRYHLIDMTTRYQAHLLCNKHVTGEDLLTLIFIKKTFLMLQSPCSQHIAKVDSMIEQVKQLGMQNIDETTCEICVICREPIQFESPWQAKCSRGHSFGRCCFTLIQLKESDGFLSCSACGKKKSSAKSSVNISSGESHLCPFCGCRFDQSK